MSCRAASFFCPSHNYVACGSHKDLTSGSCGIVDVIVLVVVVLCALVVVLVLWLYFVSGWTPTTQVAGFAF